MDNQGLYQKYTVIRNDGKDAPGEKHHGCDYFVLDLTHDKDAVAALIAYERKVRENRPALADALGTLIADLLSGVYEWRKDPSNA